VAGRGRGLLLGVVVCVVVLLWCVSGADAAVPGAALSVSVDAAPSVFSAAHNGSSQDFDSYSVTVMNSGSVATDGGAISIVDTLPPGLVAREVSGAEIEGVPPSLPCVTATVTCVYDGVLLPGDTLRMNVVVEVEGELAERADAGSGVLVSDAVGASGGGVAPVSAVESNRVGTAQESLEVPFGFERFSSGATGAGGLPDVQAGDHPFQYTASFLLNTAYGFQSGIKPLSTGPAPAGGPDGLEAELKDVVVELPAGFIGDPQAVPKCPEYKVNEVVNSVKYACPRESQIGIATIYLNPDAITGPPRGSESTNFKALQVSPIFNVQPDKGYPAQFALQVVNVVATIYGVVNEESNYAVRAVVKDIPAAAGASGGSFTFFGAPASDPNLNNAPRSASEQLENLAFLDNPTVCTTEPQYTRIYADTWENPGTWKTASAGPGGQPLVTTNAINDTSTPLVTGQSGSSGWVEAKALSYPEITGCDMLQFDPELEVLPSSTKADEASGVTVNLRVPQASQEAALVNTPTVKNTTVTLPAGLSINPSAADGLQGCSPAQFAVSSPAPSSCPPASQVATVKTASPLLPAAEPLTGEVFIGEPQCDPCSNADAADGKMLRLLLQVQGEGVVLKKEGTVYANPSTGQLTTTFSDIPQLPFSELELQFKGGLRAPLATPQSCGMFTTTADVTPWSSPVTPDATSLSQFAISWNGEGEACPSSAPFAPSFSAGTSNPDAGQFSPLTVTFDREDREQDLAGIQVTTPPGLSGILTGIPLCGEPQSSLGTCPEASRIGTMTVAAGAGSHPFYEKGSLYLTGPYEGAPFGLSIVVPTIAGPFNLGNVVVRAKINIDPQSTALTVTSDPLPQVIDGVPLRLRTANVTVEREHFVFNPTSCEQLHINATFTGEQGAIDHASVPFAVSGCAGLHYGPVLKVSTSGHTSRADGASLDVKLTVPAGAQSNTAKAKVELPKELPARLTTLQKACLAATFEANPAGCPGGSLVGYAKVTTPLLPVTLSGPAYFVSYGNAKFPELIIVLQGYGVRVDVHSETFISKKGITSATLPAVPDAPFSSFELYLPEGSALAANGNLCNEKLGMPNTFTAQDGAQLKQTSSITVTGCPKNKAKRAAKASRKAHNASYSHGSRARTAANTTSGRHVP
jgi:hypothetical protein